MADNTGDSNFIELTAGIVSAFVSNNPVTAGEIPALINQVHSALLRVSSGGKDPAAEPLKPAVSVKRSVAPDYVGRARLHRLPGGRQEIQIAQASSAHAIQHDAGAISRKMGAAGGLSDGGAELCRGAFQACQGHGARPAAPPGEIIFRWMSQSAHSRIQSRVYPKSALLNA
jgi:hypothetical protein